MNLSHFHKKQKPRAQAMLEFALALPVLLTLIYGVLETGRLLFIYASTVTAARQAVRYGSATGTSPNGMPYYQDCVGIENAAQNVGFINDFQNIEINYDSGPGTSSLGECPNYAPAINGDRIHVSVSAQWQPIVNIVPLEPFPIRSESARTILASVSIAVTALPGGIPGSGSGVLTITNVTYSLPPGTPAEGQTITYTYTLKNEGGVELPGPFTMTSSLAGLSITCAGASALAPGDTTTCTGTYQILQQDIDAGTVYSVDQASSSDFILSQVAPTVVPLTQSKSLTLTKTADPDAASTAGTGITYTYIIENSGNVRLSQPITIVDDKIPVTCPGTPATLDPGASITCSAAYQLTEADISNGSLVNTADAYAKFGTENIKSNTATATVYTTPLVVWINPAPATASLANQVIAYTYTIRNNTESEATSLSVTSTRTSPVNCATTSIPAGGTVTCTGTYTVSQADLDSGGVLVNTATATANNGADISSNTAVNTMQIVQSPKISAAISASPTEPTSPATSLPAGTIINYTYTLTNNGNVTLSSPISVSDNKNSVTCSNQASLPPGATRNCTATYTVTDDDVAAGSFVNTATASATFGTQTVTSDEAQLTIITYSSARFSLGLSADPESITRSVTPVVFTYTITNTGGKPLSSPYTITSSLLGEFTCTGASPLAPGESTSCQNSYTTSNSITNTITAATAKDAGTDVPASTPLPSLTVPSNICTTGTLTLNFMGSISSTNKVRWEISNNVGTSLHINTMSISWNTGGNRYLSEVQLPSGISVWTGSDKDGFAIFNELWTIEEGITYLDLIFTQSNTTVTDMNITFDEIGCGPLNNP
jgi:hypothetical protein